jgi:hypothetical protein
LYHFHADHISPDGPFNKCQKISVVFTDPSHTELSRRFLSGLPVQAAYFGRGGVSGLLEVRFQAGDPRGLFHTRLEDGYFLLHFRPQADLPVFTTHLGECAA